MRKFIVALLLLVPFLAAQAQDLEGTVSRLEDAGFADIRSAMTEDCLIFSLSCDSYQLPNEALSRARRIIEADCAESGMKVKLICVSRNVPEVTMSYDPASGSWSTTRKLDDSWDIVRIEPKRASSIGKVDLVLYPQVSIMNLIINQVYQTLWQISPAVEVSLWPGMKLTYQVKFPLFNDGYGELEDRIHPGMVSLTQSFRDPWNWNIHGKLSAGVFSNNRYGLALELSYYFPNQRFWVDTQLGLLANCYFDGFIFKYDKYSYFRWNLAFNYYMPALDTQFTLRAQRFLLGDVGLKYEMIRHFDRCSVGLYAEKCRSVQLNVGFRFSLSLPPYNMKRRGYVPRVKTGNLGMSYNANNERYYYKEFRTEASDNIMNKNAYNPYFIDRHCK